jgi:hypothetical protein
MTATHTNSHSGRHALGRGRRSGSIRIIAATAVVGVAATAIVTAGGGPAGAAALPQAQSVGNFLDATVGGNTLDAIAKLEYATATSPGTQSVQNPLDATVLNAIEAPLTGALQLPQLAGINNFGAVNQVAVAQHSGYSYGASGAVSNSGAVSIGANNNAFPAGASIDLCASALSGGKCGSSAADNLGQIKLAIGAVAALAQTPAGYGKNGSTDYGIAGLDLQLGSPALGQLLGQVTTALSGGFSQLTTALAPIITLLGIGLPATCVLTTGTLPTTISVDSNGVTGIVTIDASSGQITLSLDKLLKSLDLDLNNLPANTDLVKYITDNLSGIIATGVSGLVNGIIGTVGTLVADCTPAGVLAAGLQTLLNTLTGAISTATSAVGAALKSVTDALAPLLTALAGVIDIGVNVQPNGPAGTYTSPLAATPKQGTSVVDGQTIVRAIEVDLLSTLTSIPVANFAAAKVQAKALAGSSLLSLALANAAAGPSTAPAAPPNSSSAAPTSSAANTNLPTGVPAGAAGHGGSPVLPLVLLLLGLTLAGGGVVSYRMRGKFSPR